MESGDWWGTEDYCHVEVASYYGRCPLGETSVATGDLRPLNRNYVHNSNGQQAQDYSMQKTNKSLKILGDFEHFLSVDYAKHLAEIYREFKRAFTKTYGKFERSLSDIVKIYKI